MAITINLGSRLGELDGPPTPNWGRSPNWGPIGGFFVGELDFQKNVGGFYNPPTPNIGDRLGQKIKKFKKI